MFGHLKNIVLNHFQIVLIAGAPCSPLGIDMDEHEVTFANGTFFRQVLH
jgi:hypothetical protein